MEQAQEIYTRFPLGTVQDVPARIYMEAGI